MPILANSCPNANFESMELVIICCDIFFILRVQDVDLFKEYTYYKFLGAGETRSDNTI
jgi:hypothetical protein